MHIKKLSTLISIIFVIAVFTNDAKAKSVYAIIDHGYSNRNSKIASYSIDESYIEHKNTYELDKNTYPTIAYTGPVGITAGDGYLFVTHENTGSGGIDGIQYIKARTMLDQGVLEVTDSPNFAGIVYDHDNDFVFAMERDSDMLYVFTWDPNDKTLNLDNERTKTLKEIDFGCGLALDEQEDILYVTTINDHADYSKNVYCYDASEPNIIYIETIEMPYNAVGIAVYNNGDGTRYLYTGAYSYQTGSHDYLVRTDLELYANNPNDPNVFEYKDIGASVTDIAVDQDTGLVYITTSDNTIQVWNTDLPFGLGQAMIDKEIEGIQGPAGICVGQTDFVPPFGIEKQDDLTQSECIIPEDEITYSIRYDFQWTEDDDPDPNQFTSVTIVDYLPKEVDFVQADPNNGVYDSDEKTYTWTIDQDSFGDPNCFELVAKVNKLITPGEPIENSVVEIISSIEGQEYNDSDIIETAACDCRQFGTILYVDEDSSAQDPNGFSWNSAFDKLQDALAIAWPCDEIWVAEGKYKPSANDPNLSFKLARYTGLFGGFKGADAVEPETKRYERNWYSNKTTLSGDLIGNDDSNDPNRYNDNLLYVVIDANSVTNILDGFVIEGGIQANIYCENSSSIIQHNRISNGKFGIYCRDTNQAIIQNNWIYRNQYGIYLDNTSDTVVQNNTIANNSKAGIYRDGGTDPDISNCILWDNLPGKDIVDCNAVYSLITDGDIGTGNLDGDPNHPPFDDIDDNDYHIDPDSDPNGIDAGNPDGDYAGQRDIDEQFRVLDGNDDGTKRIDMGADEYCNEGDSNVADIDNDGIVNYLDFSILAAAWLDVPGIPSADIAPPEGDNFVDMEDLIVLGENWLWVACGSMENIPMSEMMMSMGKSMSFESMTLSQTASIPKPELTIKEQIEQAEENLNWLNNLWESEPEVRETIDEDRWEDFIERVEDWLDELEDSL